MDCFGVVRENGEKTMTNSQSGKYKNFLKILKLAVKGDSSLVSKRVLPYDFEQFVLLFKLMGSIVLVERLTDGLMKSSQEKLAMVGTFFGCWRTVSLQDGSVREYLRDHVDDREEKGQNNAYRFGQEMIEEFEKKEREIEVLNKRNFYLHKERKILRSNLMNFMEKSNAYSNKIVDEREKNAFLTQRVAASSGALKEAIKESLHTKMKYELEKRSLESQISLVEKENEEKEKEITILLSDCNGLKSDVKERESRICQLQDTLSTLRSDLESLEKRRTEDLKEMESRIRLLKEEKELDIQRMNAEMTELSRKFGSTLSGLESRHTTELRLREKRLEEAQHRCEKQEEAIVSLQDTLEIRKVEKVQMEQAHETELQSLCAQTRKQEERVEELKESHDHEKNENVELRKCLNAQCGTLEALSCRFDEKVERLRVVSDELGGLKKDLEGAQSYGAERARKVEELEEEKKVLESLLEEIREEKKLMVQDIEDERHKMEEYKENERKRENEEREEIERMHEGEKFVLVDENEQMRKEVEGLRIHNMKQVEELHRMKGRVAELDEYLGIVKLKIEARMGYARGTARGRRVLRGLREQIEVKEQQMWEMSEKYKRLMEEEEKMMNEFEEKDELEKNNNNNNNNNKGEDKDFEVLGKLVDFEGKLGKLYGKVEKKRKKVDSLSKKKKEEDSDSELISSLTFQLKENKSLQRKMRRALQKYKGLLTELKEKMEREKEKANSASGKRERIERRMRERLPFMHIPSNFGFEDTENENENEKGKGNGNGKESNKENRKPTTQENKNKKKEQDEYLISKKKRRKKKKNVHLAKPKPERLFTMEDLETSIKFEKSQLPPPKKFNGMAKYTSFGGGYVKIDPNRKKNLSRFGWNL